LQGVVAIGIAMGAMIAARWICLRQAVRVLPVGVAMGIAVPLMTLIHNHSLAHLMLILIGGLAGYFVVPMNALLQHRGHILMSAGHSIAVQNFNENLMILIMLGLYAGLIHADVAINHIIGVFGAFVGLSMLAVIRLHQRNQRQFDSVALIGQDHT